MVNNMNAELNIWKIIKGMEPVTLLIKLLINWLSYLGCDCESYFAMDALIALGGIQLV